MADFGKTYFQKLSGVNVWLEKGYHKSHLNDAVQINKVSKISEIIKNARFSISLTLG